MERICGICTPISFEPSFSDISCYFQSIYQKNIHLDHWKHHGLLVTYRHSCTIDPIPLPCNADRPSSPCIPSVSRPSSSRSGHRTGRPSGGTDRSTESLEDLRKSSERERGGGMVVPGPVVHGLPVRDRCAGRPVYQLISASMI